MTISPTTLSAIVVVATLIANVVLSLTGITGVVDCSVRTGAAQVGAAAASMVR